MKKVITKKAAAMATAVLMAFTVTPSVAFANTWGEGDTDEEIKSTVVVDYEEIPNIWLQDKYANPKGLYTIKFKAGELQPFTFYNAYEEIGNKKPDDEWYRNPYEEKLTEEKKRLFAKSQLKDWARIATKIYSSQSEIGGEGGMSGVTWDGPTWAEGLVTNWSDMLENDDPGDIVRINLPDWLCKEEYDEKSQGDETAYTYAAASGFQSTDSLSEVRNRLIGYVADLTGGDSGDFENRNNNQGKTLSALDDDTLRDVYYSRVTWVGNEGSTKCFNCYGIALYDFQYIPIEGDGLRYSGQSEQFDDNEGRNRVISPLSPVVNEDTRDKNMEVTLEGQKTQTQQNVMGWNESQECSYAYADRFAETFEDTWPVGYSGVKGLGNFHSALETTREEGKKVVYQASDKRKINLTVPAHSLLQVNEMKDEYTYNMMYDAASSLRYKASIFSLTGSIGEAGEVSGRGDFCTEFGAEGSISANDDANSNLYERAVKRAASDETLARTEGYYEGNQLTDGVDWTHAAFTEDVVLGGEGHPVKDVIEDRATRLPMAEVMMQLDLINTTDQQELGDTVPLYYLSRFDLSNGVRSEYPMLEGSSYPIDALPVVGKNEYDVVYSGFNEKTDQNLGSWKVATEDPEGQPLESDIVKIIEDSETGKQKIEAKKPGTAYLTWELKETKDGKAIKFTSADGKTVSATENTPRCPYVRVQVMDESAAPENIEFDPKLPESIDGIAEESINLYTALPANVLTEDGEVIDYSCTYMLADEEITEAQAKIDEYGNFTAYEPGDYEIKVEYKWVEKGTSKKLTTSAGQNKWINVQEARKLTLVPVGGTGKIDPNEDSAFSLTGCVTYVDQFDDPWTGEPPELKYTLTGSAKCGDDLEEVSRKAKIWGDQLVVDHKNIGDGDTFHIKAEAKGAADVDPISFNYVVEPVHNTDVPKAANPMKLKGKTVKIKYSKLKKKKQTIKRAKAITVSKAQGQVTYKKVSVGSKKVNKKYGKKITINSKSGKITVKKGLKKGTYKVKVKVTAAGNAKYKPVTKTVTFKIKVR